MRLWEYEGKRVTLSLSDGECLTGTVSYYTSALDNEPEPASITIGNIEIFETEIKKVELAT